MNSEEVEKDQVSSGGGYHVDTHPQTEQHVLTDAPSS